jgi:sugar lactone lactonase YvrE
MKKLTLFIIALRLIGGTAFTQDLAGDMTLHRLVIDGEGWQVVAEKLGFADAPFADAQGNFYFSDMRSAEGIFKVGLDGKTAPLLQSTNARSISGMKFGPDGRLYGCRGATKQLLAFEVPSGMMTVLAEDVQPNDLVVTHKGHIYFTETGKKQVTFVNPKTREKRAADVGITAPNGITLSPDQGTLAVSDYRGLYVWTFRIEPDGSLAAKAPYMTMRTEVDVNARSADGRSPVYKTSSGGDGMTADMQGRYYVSSSLGVQVFDPTGRMCGVLPKPSDKGMTSVGFGGAKMDYLYVTCADKIFRRKVQATGVLFNLPPPQPR